MSEKLEFDIVVPKDDLNKALDSATKKTFTLGGALESAVGNFTASVAIKSFELAGRAIGEATDFLFESVKASAESEAAFKKLEVALASTGQLTEDNVKNFKALADEIQRTTAFEDGAVVSAGALIQTLGRLSGEGLNKATSAAVDLSAALGIDLESAAQLVGKAANGNVAAFNKLGIEIQKGSTDAATFANALDVLNSRFGGSAAAQVNTFAGAFEQLKNIYGDLKETIGGLVTSNPAVIAAFNIFKNVLVQVGDSIKSAFGPDNQSQIGDIFRTMLDGVAGVALAFDAAFRIIDSTINLILGSIRVLALGIVAPIAGILELATLVPGVGDKFKGMADAATAEMNRLSGAVNENALNVQTAFSKDTFLSGVVDGIAETRVQFDVLEQEAAKTANNVKNNLAGSVGGNQLSEEEINRQKELNASLLELDNQFIIQKAALEETERVAEKERFLARTEEDIIALQQFELDKSELQYAALVERNSIIKNLDERGLANQKAIKEKEIRDLQITQKTKADIRSQDIKDQQAFFSAATSLAGSSNKELAAIGKAAGVAEIAIKTPQAVASSYAFGTKIGGPVTGAIFGGIAGVAMAAQASRLAGIKGFADGGIIGSGATLGPDNRLATVRDGELILNAQQQKSLFDAINGGQLGSNQPIIIQIDGRTIATAVRDQVQGGFKLA